MYQVAVQQQQKRNENLKKNSSNWPFLAHPAGGQETTFY